MPVERCGFIGATFGDGGWYVMQRVAVRGGVVFCCGLVCCAEGARRVQFSVMI